MQLSRNFIGIILIGCLFIGILTYNIINTSNYTVNNNSAKSYSGYGISFNYPSNWTVETETESINWK